MQYKYHDCPNKWYQPENNERLSAQFDSLYPADPHNKICNCNTHIQDHHRPAQILGVHLRYFYNQPPNPAAFHLPELQKEYYPVA